MGIDFGNTQVLVHVNLMTGRKYVFSSNTRITLEKQFSKFQSNFPLQSIIPEIATHDDHNSTFKDISDVFSINSICFSLTNPYYGTQGTVRISFFLNDGLSLCF